MINVMPAKFHYKSINSTKEASSLPSERQLFAAETTKNKDNKTHNPFLGKFFIVAQ